MANEAVIVELPRNIHAARRTIANGTAGTDITKLSLMKLTDPNTIAISDGRNEWGGVLAMEKEGGDGSVSASVYLDGVFDLEIAPGGACTIGEQVTLSGENLIDAATEAEVQLGQWVGTAEEAGSTSEKIRVRLRGY